jgi:hypothetical protein
MVDFLVGESNLIIEVSEDVVKYDNNIDRFFIFSNNIKFRNVL